VPHPTIVVALATLFSINAIYRVAHFEYVRTTFGISSGTLIVQIVVLVGLAASLLLLYRRTQRQAGAEPLAGTT
jgi:hypothetical protein